MVVTAFGCGDGGFNETGGHSTATTTPDSDGHPHEDASSASDANPQVPDAADSVGASGDQRIDAGSSSGPNGGEISDAGLPDATVPPRVGECEPDDVRVAEGEVCEADTECQPGLLCGDLAGESAVCRPIEGIMLVRAFRPEGRHGASGADGQGEYSEGLDYAHGFLWQATPYVLHQIDVEAERLVASYGTPSEIGYREGIAWQGNLLFQASYRDHNLHVAALQADGRVGEFGLFRSLDDLSPAELRQTRERRHCVYGIEHSCDVLYTTRCGDAVIDMYESGVTGGRIGSFEVRDEAGRPLPAAEDMEVYLGQLWISTFAGDAFGYNNTLFRVDLSKVEAGFATAVESYAITGCTTPTGRPTLALDGVAANPVTRELYVSGKDCPILVYQLY